MLKIRTGYSLRNVLDTYLVMGTGSAAYMPNCIMSVNGTGAFLWGLLENGAERDALVAALCAEYSVTEADAGRDVDRFLTQLRDKDLIEG